MRRLSLLLILFLFVFRCRAEDYTQWYELSTPELLQMGRSYIHDGSKNDSSIACFRIICNRYEVRPSAEMLDDYIGAISNTGIIHAYRYHDYPQAYRCYTKAYELAIEHHKERTLAIVATNLIDLLAKYTLDYPTPSLLQQCHDIALQAADAAVRSGSWDCMAALFITMVDADFELDLAPYEALMHPEAPDSLDNIQYAQSLYRALQAIRQQHYAEARMLITQNFSHSVSEMEEEMYAIASYRYLSQISMAEGNYPEALVALDSALSVIDRYGNDEGRPRVLKMKADTYQALGDQASYSDCRLRYFETRDSLDATNHLQSLAELDFLHRIDLEQERISQLSHDQRLLWRWLFAALFFLCIVTLFGVVVYRQKRHLAEVNQGLYNRIQHELEHPAMAAAESPVTTGDTPVSAFSRLDDERKEELWKNVLAALDDVALICSPDFSLAALAKRVESNSNYVSAIIGERTGQGFLSLVSELRIREACRRMNDVETYGKYTIEAISQSVGFKSRVTFVSAFKKQLSLTPSEYKRIAQQQNDA